jgi:Tfp pilus assembly protein PilF
MPTLALSMIVKNGERDLPDCLASVRGVVDEIVVADTGSSDASIELARAAGARVISIPWEDDFAKARNLSLAEVTSDWVLMLDADERLDPGAAALLPALLSHRAAAGYQVTIRNYVSTLEHKIWDRPAKPNDSDYGPARSYPAYVDHENVRLFRREPDIYFTGRVHETVGWQILAAKRLIASSNLLIHHMGMVRDDEERARKIVFYRDLGRMKVADMPGNSQAHFELGVSEMENLGNVQEALKSFERSCELNPQSGVAWFFMGVCRFRLGEPAKALECFRRAEAAGHSTPWLAEISGDSRYNLAHYEAARDCYSRGLKRSPTSASLESKLGLAEARCGKPSSGLRRLRRAIQREPSNPELHDRLVMAELWLNHVSQGAQAAEEKLAAVKCQPEDFVRAASIRAKLEDFPRVLLLLRRGLELFPTSDLLKAHLHRLETTNEAADTPVAEKIHT